MFHRCTALALLAAAASTDAADWRMDPGASTLAFAGSAQGERFEGRFTRFEASVRFDPAQPEATAIAARIDTASADSANAERDDTLRGPDFFDVARFPAAQFRTLACRALKVHGEYACDAELTIRDRTRALDFRFAWQPGSDGSARLAATVPLSRLAYDVGGGDWADTETIADAVTVTVALALTATP